MAKITSDNTMAKRTRTIQWQKEQGQYNGKNNKDNTMAKRTRTIQWQKEQGQYNGKKNKDNKTNNDL